MATEAIDPPVGIIVYICPTPGCGNFYSARNFRPDRDPKIEQPQTRRSQNDGQITDGPPRIECPDCRTRGITAERVPYIVTAVIKLQAAVRALTA